MMNGQGKSDRPIVPTKPSNKDLEKSAERAEGRGLTKGNSSQQTTGRIQGRDYVQSALGRVRQAAKREKTLNSLMHHIYDIRFLRESYFSVKRNAAAGVDGETWQSYGESLEENLQDLSARLKRGGYRAKPVRRQYIPKSDGRQRPLGVPMVASYCTPFKFIWGYFVFIYST